VIRAVAALLCLAGAMAVQYGRDRAYPRNDPDTQRLLYVRSPAALDRMALGFDALAADVYWIRAIQHYGGDRLDQSRSRRYELLYPLLDLATSLDPYFNIAYRFGAIFLSEAPPGGPGRPDHAVALLRKGIAAQPTKWQYFHDIAFVHYWALRDPIGAAAWFRRAAEQPGAPNWLMPVAAAMLTQGSDRASSRFLWQQILGSDQAWLRRRAEHALLQLDALDQIDQLRVLIVATPRSPGEPYTWEWLVRARRLRGVPLDPSGTPYVLDPATGDVTVAQGSLLFPLPKPVERHP
jgi:hypothetical protein